MIKRLMLFAMLLMVGSAFGKDTLNTKQRIRLMYYIISSQEGVSSDLFIPVIDQELEKMTHSNDSAYFSKPVNFNKLVETNSISKDVLLAFKQNVNLGTTSDAESQKKISSAFKAAILQADQLLTIKVNQTGDILEYQFYLYEVKNDNDSVFVLESFVSTLTNDLINEQSVLVSADNYETQLRRGLRKLFPDSNKPPKATISFSNHNLRETSSSTKTILLEKIYCRVGDTLELKATVEDEDSEVSEEQFKWSVNTTVDREQKTAYFSKRLPDTDSTFSIYLVVSDGISSSKTYQLPVECMTAPDIPEDFLNTSFYFSDHYYNYIQLRGASKNGNTYQGSADILNVELIETETSKPIEVRKVLIDPEEVRMGTVFDIYDENWQDKYHRKYAQSLLKTEDISWEKEILFVYYTEVDSSNDVIWFQRMFNLRPKTAYSLSLEPEENGVVFPKVSRKLEIHRTPKFKYGTEIFSLFNTTIPDDIADGIQWSWAPSISLSYRLLGFRSGFPLDIELGAMFPVQFGSRFAPDILAQAYVIPRGSLIAQFLKYKNFRVSGGPSFIYNRRSYWGTREGELMSGFTLDPRFLVKNTTTELGLTYRHYWGRDFYDNSRYNAWQIAITTNIFF